MIDLSRLPAILRPPLDAYDADAAEGFNFTALVEATATKGQQAPIAAELRRMRRAAAFNARWLALVVTLLEGVVILALVVVVLAIKSVLP